MKEPPPLIQFHLAPWKAYKPTLLATALMVLALIFNAAKDSDAGTHAMRHFTVFYSMGWFLVLFGDATWNGMTTKPLRAHCFLLGCLLLLFCFWEALSFI